MPIYNNKLAGTQIISGTEPASNLGAGAFPFITISAKGIALGNATLANNGAMFGPDTPSTTTCGIQEAINSLHVATQYGIDCGGGKLMFGPGIFTCSGEIVIPGNFPYELNFIGSGKIVTLLKYTGTNDFITISPDPHPGGSAAKVLNWSFRDIGFCYQQDTLKKHIVWFKGNDNQGFVDNCLFAGYSALTYTGTGDGGVLAGGATLQFVGGVVRAAAGVVGLRSEGTADNKFKVKHSDFYGLAVGIVNGHDHCTIEDCMFSSIGRWWGPGNPGAPHDQNAWTPINSPGSGANAMNNIFAAGPCIVGFGGVYEMNIVNNYFFESRTGIINWNSTLFGPQMRIVSPFFETCAHSLLLCTDATGEDLTSTSIFDMENAGPAVEWLDITNGNITGTRPAPGFESGNFSNLSYNGGGALSYADTKGVTLFKVTGYSPPGINPGTSDGGDVLIKGKFIKAHPQYVTVSARGQANTLSNSFNDGAMFGPDTPSTTTCGIQEAINSLFQASTYNTTTTGGGMLVLGKGIFPCTTQITIPNTYPFNLVIEGQGQTNTLVHYTSATAQDFIITGRASGDTSHSTSPSLNLVIRDAGFTYNTDTNKNYIMHLNWVNKCLINNCLFTTTDALSVSNVGIALDMDAPGKPSHAVGVVGLRLNHGAGSTEIRSCNFHALAAGAVLVDRVKTEVQDCFFAHIGYWFNPTFQTSTLWTTTATVSATQSFNNVYAYGAGLAIFSNVVGETHIHNCKWVHVRICIFSGPNDEQTWGGVQNFIIATNIQGNNCDYRYVYNYDGLYPDDAVIPTVFTTYEDLFVAMPSGDKLIQLRVGTTESNRPIFNEYKLLGPVFTILDTGTGGTTIFSVSGPDGNMSNIGTYHPGQFTKAARNALGLGAGNKGAIVYQTDNTPGLRTWNGTHWVKYTETNDD